MGEDEVIREDAGDEEGEVADQDDKVRYDVDKLAEWPGFNAPMPDGYRDETRDYRCPRIRDSQMKEGMVKEMSTRLQKGYVRAEMQDTSRKKKEKRKVEESSEEAKEEKPTSPALNPGLVLTVDEGTPIVEMHSPFGRLPDQSKWSKDTTDHILFENLPDSTGKWDQMREVIKRGRKLREETAAAAATAVDAPDADDGGGDDMEECEA